MLQASTGLRCWPREVSEANRGRDNTLKVNGQTLMVVDEAAMVGTDDLRHLLTAMTTAGSKTVLVGDTYKPLRQSPRRDVRPTLHRPAMDPTTLRSLAHARSRRTHGSRAGCSECRARTVLRGPPGRNGVDIVMLCNL
jgi:hypothetical protein